MNKNAIKKIVTGVLVFGYIITGFIDLSLHGQKSYSSIMGMDINRVYFYTFFLLTIGCWLLYNKWFVGIGFLALATFSSYFTEFITIHNYFASILIYIGITIDILIRRKIKWLIPLIVVGLIQGLAFQTAWLGSHFVGYMECLALCIGAVFVVKTIGGQCKKYDFDRVTDRQNTYSIKYNPVSRGMPDDVLPMWVADMDFPAPPCVIDALAAQVRHGIYGYSEPDAAYFAAVQSWFKKRFNWSVEQNWLVITPGVVNALYISVRALTERDGGVLIQQPVYYPFESCVRQTGRKLIVNELVYKDGRYSIDFDDFENKVKEAKLFILCSPHNPVGRVWTRDELVRMGEICLRYGVTVIADEIHQDFIYPGYKHLVFAGIDPRFADITITCTSLSKTFNLAGLLHANIFIENENLRSKFKREYTNCGLSQPSVMGLAACKAAYENGAEWADELVAYLHGNMTLIKEFLQTNIPKIKLVEPEGTYLAWLDFSQFALSAQELDQKITHEAKLWLNSGPQFGKGGEGFQRINAACPRSVLLSGLERLKNIFA